MTSAHFQLAGREDLTSTIISNVKTYLNRPCGEKEKKIEKKRDLLKKKKVRKIELSEREESQYRFFVSITYEIVFFSGGGGVRGERIKNITGRT